LAAGIAIGWVLGFISLLTIYIIWKVFPNLDGYVNIVRSYAKFLREDKAKERRERKEKEPQRMSNGKIRKDKF
jgi:hypothetical protein